MRRVRVVVRVANAAAVSAPARARSVVRLALGRPGPYGLPDIVLLSEVSPVAVAEVARSYAPGVQVVQHGTPGSPEAGVAVASRLGASPKRTIVGSLAVRGKVRMRPILGARIGSLQVWAIHAPPGRAPVARALYIARARRRGGLCGGDWNHDRSFMARTSVRHYRGVGVLGLLVPRRWGVSRAANLDIGSDHDAVDVVVSVPAWRLR